MFRTLSPGDSISVALRKLLQGGRRGSQATCKFATKAAGTLNIKDQVSNQGIWHSVYGKMQAPRLTYFTCISAIWGESCFLAHLASCIPKLLSNHLRGGSGCRIAVWGSPHSHLEARNCCWLWHFLFINMARGIFISQEVLLCLVFFVIVLISKKFLCCFAFSLYPITSQWRGKEGSLFL